MSNIQDIVEYRPIKGFPGYRVGSDGSVWSCKAMGPRLKLLDTWHLLSPGKHSAGYVVFGLRRGRGNCSVFFAHRLVLEAFIGPCPVGMECCHGDGVRNNNQLTNLRWGTSVENAGDKVKHNTEVRGSRRWNATLNERDIPIIISLWESGSTKTAIAKRFGVSFSVIHKVVIGKNWKHAAREVLK